MVAPEINARDAIEGGRSPEIKARSPHIRAVVGRVKLKKYKFNGDLRPWFVVRARRTPQAVGSFETLAARSTVVGGRKVVQVVDMLCNEGIMSVSEARKYLTYERTEEGRRMVVADATIRSVARDECARVERLALLGTVWPESTPGYDAYNREVRIIRKRAGLPFIKAPTHKPRFVPKSTATELERLAADLERVTAKKAEIAAAREERENEVG